MYAWLQFVRLAEEAEGFDNHVVLMSFLIFLLIFVAVLVAIILLVIIACRRRKTRYCLWSPYVIGQTIIFLPCDFYLLSSFFFSFLA